MTGLTGYRIYHGTTPGVYSPPTIDVGNALSYVWDGLTPQTTHYWAVTAYDPSNNEGPKSTEVNKTF